MALHFSANQYEQAYKPRVLRNWEVPKQYDDKPRQRTGCTQVISNERGHLLPGVPRSRKSPWGNFIGTWHLPKKIDRQTAEQLNGTIKKLNCEEKRNRAKEKKEKLEQIKEEVNVEKVDEVVEKLEEIHEQKIDEEKEKVAEEQERNKENTCPYVPGDLTDEKHRLPSHDSLAQNRYQNNTDDSGNGYPRYREDFSKPLPEIKNKTIPRDEVEAECQNHKRMAEHNYICNGIKEAVRKKTPSPIIAAIKNFQLAKKLHRENLEHDPLPDTITNSKYRRLQMQRSQKDPGLALNDDNYATGIGWKGYPGYGPTRCTKLKVYRPKTCGHTDKHEIKNDGRPSSVTSFDRKWRFIRQRKVTPIELAICWDLTPENPKDEPKRTPHIDGSNGSLAPAVFSLVHTPKEEDSRKSSITTECSHHTEPIFEKGPIRSSDEKDFVLDRPKTSHPQETKRRTSRDSVQSEESLSKKRAKSAYNLSNNRHDDKEEKQSCSRCSHEEVHQSTPNLSEHGGSYNKKIKNSRTCTACELKKLSLKDRRPKNINNEFKMAFKAGVPQKCKDKREDYPEHWRLATVYQHSYKPIHSRKRPLLATVFK